MSTTPTQQMAAVSTATTKDDEIDLRQLAGALVRQRRLIAIGAACGLALSGMVTLIQKRVWEGEFQIVLAKKESGAAGKLSELAAANPILAGMAGIGGATTGGASLETEVKILKSPSVLKPVFDYVRLE